ncbi:hypothetical protein K438DRAFT_1843741 [Mycena galopus ATCC 62051]|nr:hypothetical protein K438DRAFT_1843741 [Mycena galopus ATCC 62051]
MIASQVPVHHVIVILASLLPLVIPPSSMRRFSIFSCVDLQSLSNRSDCGRRRTVGFSSHSSCPFCHWACFRRTKTKTGDGQLTTANLINSGLSRGNLPVPSPIPVAPPFRSSCLLDRLPIRSGDG